MNTYRVIYAEGYDFQNIRSRHRTSEAACRACLRYQRGLEAHNPGTRLACGFVVQELRGDTWQTVYDPWNGAYED